MALVEQRTYCPIPNEGIFLIRICSKDGGKSTEATVMDGGEDEGEKDETYKPS